MAIYNKLKQQNVNRYSYSNTKTEDLDKIEIIGESTKPEKKSFSLYNLNETTDKISIKSSSGSKSTIKSSRSFLKRIKKRFSDRKEKKWTDAKKFKMKKTLNSYFLNCLLLKNIFYLIKNVRKFIYLINYRFKIK